MATKKTVKPKNESSISYSGEVNIKLKKGNSTVYEKTISNMGTLNMFLGIAYALANSPTTNYIPRYLGIGYSTTEKIKVETNSMDGEKVRAPLNTSTTIENITGPDIDGNLSNIGKQISFKALLPYSLIGASNNINELGLFGTEEGESLLARIWWEPESAIEIKAGMDLIVTWKISIKNKGDQ